MTKRRSPAQRVATRGRWLSVACIATFALAACKPRRSNSTGSVSVQRGPAPAASVGEVDLPADDGQWIRPAKDDASTRFSGLSTGKEVWNTKVGGMYVFGL